MNEVKKKTRSELIVELTNAFFQQHSELNCCCNKTLREGTWQQIKINAEREYQDQYK